MENLKIFTDRIKTETGIEIALYNHEGVCLSGNDKQPLILADKIDGVVLDVEKNQTLFSLTFAGRKLIGKIFGATQVEKNYALLISKIVENYTPNDFDISREEFNSAILAGKIDFSRISAFMTKFALPDLPCSVMIITAKGENVENYIEVVENYGNSSYDFIVKIDKEMLAYVKFKEESEEDYYSFQEFAESLAQSVYEERGIKIQVYIGGKAKTLSDISVSYSQALATVRMCALVSGKGNIHTFKEYMIIKMFEDLPKHKLREYLEILMDSDAKEIFKDQDMINTAEEFLDNSLNLSETSRKLYMHRNTLMYRLDKIERLTGLNIRNFADAITFRFITVLNKLVK